MNRFRTAPLPAAIAALFPGAGFPVGAALRVAVTWAGCRNPDRAVLATRGARGADGPFPTRPGTGERIRRRETADACAGPWG